VAHPLARSTGNARRECRPVPLHSHFAIRRPPNAPVRSTGSAAPARSVRTTAYPSVARMSSHTHDARSRRRYAVLRHTRANPGKREQGRPGYWEAEVGNLRNSSAEPRRPPIAGDTCACRQAAGSSETRTGSARELGRTRGAKWGSCGTGVRRPRRPAWRAAVLGCDCIARPADRPPDRPTGSSRSVAFVLPRPTSPFPLLFILQGTFLSFHGGAVSPLLDGGREIERGNGRDRRGKGAVPGRDERGTSVGKRGDRWGREGYRSGKRGELGEGVSQKWEGRGKD